MDKSTIKFSILTKSKGSKYVQKYFNDKSVLVDYNNIFNLKSDKNDDKNIILLTHPKLKTLKVNNKKEWDFLYRNNIINDCIETVIINKEKKITKTRLKINFVKQSSENEESKYPDIIAYIMDNITPDNYISYLLNFLSIRKDVINDFKLYLMNILLDLQNLHEDNKDLIKEKNEGSKYIVETEDFFKILERKLNEIKNSYQNFKINETLKSLEIVTNYTETNYEELENNSKSNFSNKISNINLDKMEIIGGNFALQNKEEYYSGFENFKDNLKRKIKEIL